MRKITQSPSNTFWELVRNGPMTLGELGIEKSRISQQDRHKFDMRILNPYPVKYDWSYDSRQTVIYLNGYHDIEDVLWKWLDSNREALEVDTKLTKEDLTRDFSGPVKRAWNEIKGDVDFVNQRRESGSKPARKSESKELTCPFCKESIKRYPSHLPTCPEK